MYDKITDMKEVKKRILWVDIAKAFAILSVPISHCLPLGTTLRALIFSVHMPLFFILSGFTTKLASDWKTVGKRLKKNFLYLILPTLGVISIFAFTEAFKFGGIELFPSKVAWTLREFFIKNYPDGLYNAGAVWFLVALFNAKLIMDVVNTVIKSEKSGIVFFLFGALGIYMGVKGIRLPFFVDLALVASMFIEVGILWRKYEKTVKKYSVPLLLAAGAFWFSRVMRGDFLEFWTRFYAGYEISIFEAVAGSFVIGNIAMMLEESLKKAGKIQKKLMNALIVVGKNTMLLYLIHCLDTSIFNFWNFSVELGVFATCLTRLALNLAIFVVIRNGYLLFKNRDKRKRDLKNS